MVDTGLGKHKHGEAEGFGGSGDFLDRLAAVGLRTTGWCVALDDEVIARSLRAVHERSADPWTVESLGAHAGLSRAAFARRFTAIVGQPPLTTVQFEHAQQKQYCQGRSSGP